MAKTLLVKNAELLVTMDGERREIRRGGLFIEDNLIKQVGPSESLPQQADVILDMTGKVVIPGLVNTHHHLFQTLTRAVPAAQDAALFGWLRTRTNWNLWPLIIGHALVDTTSMLAGYADKHGLLPF